MSHYVPTRKRGDKVRVMNTITADRLRILGKSGTVVRKISPDEYLIRTVDGEEFECHGSILVGMDYHKS